MKLVASTNGVLTLVVPTGRSERLSLEYGRDRSIRRRAERRVRSRKSTPLKDLFYVAGSVHDSPRTWLEVIHGSARWTATSATASSCRVVARSERRPSTRIDEDHP